MQAYYYEVRRQMGIPSGGDSGRALLLAARDMMRGEVWMSRVENVKVAR